MTGVDTRSRRSGRENRDVHQFPPPTGGPVGSSDPQANTPQADAPTGPGGRLPFSTDPSEWDWDRIRDRAEWWFRPLVRPESWRALGYLFVGALTGAVFFALVIAFAAIVFALSFVLVGLLLVGAWFGLVRVFTDVERSMAGWVGVDIPGRELRPRGRLGWGSVTDPERWRMVGYVVVNVVLSSALFGLGTALYTFAFRAIFGSASIPGLDFWPFNLIAGAIGVALGIAAIGAAPRVAVMVAALKANVTAWFLGPDRLRQAEERVTELSTQRQDILDAVAGERRRIERNLHDGVQQQLVAIGLDLGMAEQQLTRDPERARELLVHAREKVQGSIGELRQLGRGLHPAILADRGIDAALSAIVSNAPIPISVHVDPALDLDTDVAETVYFVANEAIANVLKHARARVASVRVDRIAANVRVTVHDDGVGGADVRSGTGLAGIRARAQAADGSCTIASPPGGPTTLTVELPQRIVRRPEPNEEMP